MFYNGDCVIYTNSNRNKSLYGVVQPMMLPILNSNICVFEVKIKVNEGKTFCFQIKKYDNVFITFRNFCMYNNIPPYFYKPILIQIFLAMNRTFELFNIKMSTGFLGSINLGLSNLMADNSPL